jgi:DNA replication protein DnaC
MIGDRCRKRATIIATQLPIEHWHSWIGDATIADAMLDRLLPRADRIQLKVESLRKESAGKFGKSTLVKEESKSS